MVGLIPRFLFSCAVAAVIIAQNESRDIAAIVEASGFSTLLRLLMQAGLKQALMQEGPFTLFAPTNEAFKTLDQSMIEHMLFDGEKLQSVLLYHMISGEITSDQIFDEVSVSTLEGKELTFFVDPPNVRVNEANIIESDILASNGVIHVVNEVLLPPENDSLLLTPEGPSLQNSIVEVAAAMDLSTVNKLLSDAGLTATLSRAGPYTLFAPSEKAFSELDPVLFKRLREDGDLLRNILLYHILLHDIFSANFTNNLSLNTIQGHVLRVGMFRKPSKQVLMVNGANFIRTDINASNGVVHIVDKVLIPPDGDVVDVLTRDSDFSLLVDAISETGLTEFLKTDSSFTVLAPDNDAFQNLDPEVLEKAMKQKGILSETILRHVILGINHGPLFSSAICWDSIVTANNIMLKTGIGTNGTLKIVSPFGRTTVVEADKVASNGVIHKINAVL